MTPPKPTKQPKSKPEPTKMAMIQDRRYTLERELRKLHDEERQLLIDKIAQSFDFGYTDNPLPEEVITLLPTTTLKLVSRVIDKVKEKR